MSSPKNIMLRYKPYVIYSSIKICYMSTTVLQNMVYICLFVCFFFRLFHKQVKKNRNHGNNSNKKRMEILRKLSSRYKIHYTYVQKQGKKQNNHPTLIPPPLAANARFPTSLPPPNDTAIRLTI